MSIVFGAFVLTGRETRILLPESLKSCGTPPVDFSSSMISLVELSAVFSIAITFLTSGICFDIACVIGIEF